LATLLKAGPSQDSKLATSFNSNKETPEVIVIFVEPELATDQFSQYASAYASTPGGSFSHLKETLDAATSSLVIPYATVAQISLFDRALSNAYESMKEGSVFIARAADSDLFILLGRQSGVKTVEIDSLMTELRSANAFANGVTDLVVVCFDKPASSKAATFSSHDEIIGTISQGVQSGTKGNYVAMYSANMPSASRFIWNFDSHTETERFAKRYIFADTNVTNITNSTNSTNTTYTVNYFPGALIEVYLITAILLAMVFTGGCAIFSLQTPDRWDAPKVKSQTF